MASEIADVLILVAIKAEIGKVMVSPTAQLVLLMLPIVATTLKLEPPPDCTVMVPVAVLGEPVQPPVMVTV